jgi:hypothetical protein
MQRGRHFLPRGRAAVRHHEHRQRADQRVDSACKQWYSPGGLPRGFQGPGKERMNGYQEQHEGENSESDVFERVG